MAHNLRHARLWFLMGWTMVVTVIVLSLVRVDVDLGQGGDKWSHFAAYGGLMFWFACLHSRGMVQLLLAVGFVALGVTLEFLQGLTGYRAFEVADMVANGLGVLIGWTLARTPLCRILPWVDASWPRDR